MYSYNRLVANSWQPKMAQLLVRRNHASTVGHSSCLQSAPAALQPSDILTIIKVKAHTGIAGDERADTLANKARDPALCDTSMNQGNSAHAAHYWPMYMKSLPDASLAPDKFAADLCGSLEHHVSSSCARGLANPSQYEDYWQAIMPHLHKISFSFWTSLGLSEAIRRQVILASFGQTWNMNQA